MAYRKIGTGWNERMREDIDTMFLELYKEYTGAGSDATEAREKAVQAVADALIARSVAETTRDELTNIIREQTSGGDIVPEVVQSRGEHATLGERLNSFNQDLAQKADKGELLEIENTLEFDVAKSWEVAPREVITDGLINRFDFNEGTGTTVFNKARAENLTIVGSNVADVWTTVAPGGSRVAKFFGNNKAVMGKPPVPLGDKFTIMIAFKNTKQSAESYFFERSKNPISDGLGLRLAFRGDNINLGNRAIMKVFALQTDGQMMISEHLMAGTGADAINEWFMFAIVRDGDYIREYLNGTLLTQYKSNFETFEEYLSIGNSRTGTNAAVYIGLYLEYNRALSDSEILNNTALFKDKFKYDLITEERRIKNAHSLKLPSKPLFIPTYEGTGETIHPSALHFNLGWHGYRYWMANTPYPRSSPNYENPSIYVSDDGLDWFEPNGLTNPIEPGGDATSVINADTELFYNEASDDLWVYWIQWDKNGDTVRIYRKKSANGIEWGVKELVIETPMDNRDICPVLIKVDSEYIMYTTNPNNTIRKRFSTDGLSFGAPVDCHIESNPSERSSSWHFDVEYDVEDNKYYLFDRKNTGRTISMYESEDGTNFSFITNLINSTDRLDRNIPFLSMSLYRPAVVRMMRGHYRMYFGVLGVNENRTALVDVKRINGEWVAVPNM